MGKLKGIVFTLDATIAVLMGVILLYSIAASQSSPSFQPASHYRALAENFLASLEETGQLGDLHKLDDASAAQFLSAAQARLIGAQLGSNVTVEFYQYVPGGSCPASCQLAGLAPINSFCLCKRYSSSTSANYSDAFAVASSRRVTYIGEKDWYCIATAEVFIQ